MKNSTKPGAGARRSVSRRKILKALGIGATMSPLIPLLNASGQESTRPKRLLLLYTPDGAPALEWGNSVDWRPTGGETDFTFHAIHEPLTPMKSKIFVPGGLTLSAAGAGEAHAHGMAGLWTGATLAAPSGDADFDGGNGARTGWGTGPSIDQMAAEAFGSEAAYAVAADDPNQETPFRTVELGVGINSATSLTRMIYSGANSPLHPETSPRAAFDRLFAGVTPSTDEPSIVDPTAAQRQTEDLALVNFVRGDLGRLRTKVGSEDYHKIDAHLDGLRAIEQRLNTSVIGSGASACALPAEPGGGAAFPDEIQSMIDITVSALACDVTRVMSLQLSYAFSYVRHDWLGHTLEHHTMSHLAGDYRPQLTEIDNWYAQQVITLLEKMDAIDEGDGTLLDNTLIVWGRELGNTAHQFTNAPFIVAGGARHGLATGRFKDFSGGGQSGGQKHAKLLVSICQMMGVETDSVGDIDANSGSLDFS
jgi:hypothetical protein